ncbi:fused PTS fructose transporter subunit IIA/HPr protein [Vibrio ostreicida]|uniref:Multiphosphoryl transfer protein n=1 Tax=Vibrio ostreicida TaxID=526588 RepID=A0ABT8C013_9VIBR|nr:fused PTS fructose transporter subunit IIA/HPr protein [Vibrio ostreicida]MDN3611680.1 fused PTS fructose transporter subunit IIA/HPr protein [Vibrio ostreicida]NPD10122.1 fused PTS fructose transporter subunit IIA/HPr protein [Vibrio ostreicida]
MLKITEHDISFNQHFSDKESAIKFAAHTLIDTNKVTSGYAQGMLKREQLSSTYLGNGIAMPHGTIETRDRVRATGVSIVHIPQGVDWGEGQWVYVVIGIAAMSTEHLSILEQLTKVISTDGFESLLKQVQTAQQLSDLLNQNIQMTCELSPSLMELNLPISDMWPLTAMAGELLNRQGYINKGCVADLIMAPPTHLGKGVWLSSSATSVLKTALAIVSVAEPFEFEGRSVKTLITVAACNQSHRSHLDKISELVAEGQQLKLTSDSKSELLSLFDSTLDDTLTPSDTMTQAVFTIKNTHGLHARPGAMLVAEAKKFESTLTVSNLNGTDTSVNAKSLMKVIALGVKSGHQLKFTANGPDAAQALQSIGNVIDSGLGEG